MSVGCSENVSTLFLLILDYSEAWKCALWIPRNVWPLETCGQRKREVSCQSGDCLLVPSQSSKGANHHLSSRHLHLLNQRCLIIHCQFNNHRSKIIFQSREGSFSPVAKLLSREKQNSATIIHNLLLSQLPLYLFWLRHWYMVLIELEQLFEQICPLLQAQDAY